MRQEAHIKILETRHIPKFRDGEDFELDIQVRIVAENIGQISEKQGTLRIGFSGSLLAQWGVHEHQLMNLARRITVNYVASNVAAGNPGLPPDYFLTTENSPHDIPVDLKLQIDERDLHTVWIPEGNAAPPPELFDPREIDALYASFPSFSKWAATPVELGRWEHFKSQLAARSTDNIELLRKALEIARRAAAVETGAIEGLYATDRGFTATVAIQAAHWEATLDSKGAKAKSLIQSQLAAYDYVLDFATRKAPLVEVWIRELHARLAKDQETYMVYTRIGPQEQALPLGTYKTSPNHVRDRNGGIHPYAPVEATPMEMARFLEELRSPQFQEAHPILQASYAHYVLTAIHPFADGNGRVARALASVFTYRAASVPILVTADTRPGYYDALEAADAGDFAPFISFIAARAVDALRLADDCLSAALGSTVETAVTDLKNLYVTSSGLTHQEVDDAAYRLLNLAYRELEDQLKVLLEPNRLIGSVVVQNAGYSAPTPNYRTPVKHGSQTIYFVLQTAPPASAHREFHLCLEVPTNASTDSEIFLFQGDLTTRRFGVLIPEVVPNATLVLQMRLSVFVRRLLAEELNLLLQLAKEAMRSSGY